MRRRSHTIALSGGLRCAGDVQGNDGCLSYSIAWRYVVTHIFYVVPPVPGVAPVLDRWVYEALVHRESLSDRVPSSGEEAGGSICPN